MSEPFLAEIRLFGFDFPPRGWARCDGQLLPINQNQSLYSLVGTTYGGDGRTDFALPDLRGRTGIHVGPTYSWGQRGGEETHSLTEAEIPTHTHPMAGTNSRANSADPDGRTFAVHRRNPGFHPVGDGLAAPDTIGAAGGGQGHQNMQPFTVVNFCIALTGTFPPRN